jgi:hypothetical protein
VTRSNPEITFHKPTYRDEFAPVGKISCYAHLFGKERVDVGFGDH